jgi:hypothetical protein
MNATSISIRNFVNSTTFHQIEKVFGQSFLTKSLTFESFRGILGKIVNPETCLKCLQISFRLLSGLKASCVSRGYRLVHEASQISLTALSNIQLPSCLTRTTDLVFDSSTLTVFLLEDKSRWAIWSDRCLDIQTSSKFSKSNLQVFFSTFLSFLTTFLEQAFSNNIL